MKFRLVNTSKPVDFEYDSHLPSEYRDKAKECKYKVVKDLNNKNLSTESRQVDQKISTESRQADQKISTESRQADQKISTESRQADQKINRQETKNKRDRIEIKLRSGMKKALKIEAAKRGMSVTKMIAIAIVQYINNDGNLNKE